MNISSNKVGQLVGKAFASYRNEVLSVFLQYGISMEDAEDLTQHVFLKLLGVDIVHEESLKALVMVTALNLRKDYCRKQAFRRKSLAAMDTPDTIQHSCEHEVMAKDIEAVEQYVVSKRLNSINASIYSLSRREGLPAKDIALRLGLDVRAVEYRLYYARKIVREKIAMVI